MKALRRLAAKLGVSADYLETGSDLDRGRGPRASALEPRARGPPRRDRGSRARRCASALDEALAAGDRSAVLRARVSLASLALERDAFADAATLLEAAVAGEAFSAIDRFDIFANLGRAYAGAGHPERAAELFQECIAAVEELGGDPSVEARYATLLSYALTDMGEIARAEEVVRHALERTKDTSDPYMRVRLYWSIARLAHAEGRDSVALTNVRKAIALLQATDDTFHLARAHILAAGITLGRENADDAENHLVLAEKLARHVDRRRRTRSTSRRAARASRCFATRPRTLRASPARPSSSAARRSRPRKGSRSTPLRTRSRCRATSTAADTAYGQAVELLEIGAAGATPRRRAAPGDACCATTAARRRRSTCSTRQPSSACARRPRPRTPSVDGRARGHAPRAVLARAVGAPLERRDADVPRRRSSRPSLDVDGPPSSRVRGSRRTAPSRSARESAAGARAAALAPRARRRPLRASSGASATTRCSAALRAQLRGLRPVRVPTVAQALLRAYCGQLIEAKRARAARADDHPRALRRQAPSGLHVSPTTRDLAALAPSQLRALGLHARRGAVARAALPGDRARAAARRPDRSAVAARLERERGLGPWSVGVVCLEGLGRYDYGLVGDLGLVKLCARCAAGRSRAGRRPSCSSRTASGPGSRACTCSPASRAGSCR